MIMIQEEGKLKVRVSDFLTVLSYVKPGLADKEIVEQSSRFIFLKEWVVAYSGEMTIRYPFNIGFECSVWAEGLYSLLQKVKEDEVIVDRSEDGKQIIISGIRTKFRSGLSVDTEIKLPVMDFCVPSGFRGLPQNFLEALKVTSISVSSDASKPHLCCIHMTKSFFESCDGYRLTRFQMTEEFPFEEIKIPFRLIQTLDKYIPVEVAYMDGWAHFRSENGVVYSCGDFVGEYPDLTPFIDFSGKEFHFPTEIVPAVKRAEVLASQELTGDKLVDIKFTKDGMELGSQSEKGWYTERFRVRRMDGDLHFKISSKVLLDALGHFKKVVVGDNKLKFETDSFVHVVSLL